MTNRPRPCWIAIAAAAFAALAVRGIDAQSGARVIIVLSDLHLGVEPEPAAWPGEFAAFLEAVNRGAPGATDLILNGDTFDLAPTRADDCGAGTTSGCSEAEAVRRLDAVVARHRPRLDALAAFAGRSGNRVVFVPGDQDAALLFGDVRRRLQAAFGAARRNVSVAAAGYWLSSDGQVYAEHGHQIGLSQHRLDGWPSPFVSNASGVRLVRSAGEQLTADLTRRYRAHWPAADYVAARGSGYKYALATGGAEVATLVVDALRLQFSAPAWQQFRMELDDGEVRPPEWDLAAVKAQGAAFFAAAVPDDDPLKPALGPLLAAGHLDAVSMSDEELVALCDYRGAVRRARRRFEPTLTQLTPRGPAVTECPRTPNSRGAAFEYFWRSRDQLFTRHLEQVAARLPRPSTPVRVFVHGHTHLPDRAQTRAQMISGGLLTIPMEGFSPRRGQLTPVVINGGAWRRTITPVRLESLAAERGRRAADVLAAMPLEDLPPCYSFVHIARQDDAAVPAVRYWRRTEGDWSIGPDCGG